MTFKLRSFRLVAVMLLLTYASLATAQDLDPRAYLRLPIRTNTIVTGFAYSYGGVVTDPTVPIEDLEADVQSASVGYVHTFNLFGFTSQALGTGFRQSCRPGTKYYPIWFC